VLRLITLPISHYCEKARWALERAGIAYREERHVQLIHRFAARRAGGHNTVPVLVTADAAIADSSEIVAWVDERTPDHARLFAAANGGRGELARVCARLDGELGPRARRLIYTHMIRGRRELAQRFNNTGVPAWEDRTARLLWPALTAAVARVLGIRPGSELQDEAAVWRELDWVAELRADGRPYLLGERFGAADLTFAALAAAVIVPPIYSVPLPQPEILPADTAELVRRARAHPAGAFALELFQRHRRERVA
jgi:glutathione S-transferase